MFKRTANPISDMEYSQIDIRPVLGHCPVCNEKVHGSNDTMEADDHYEIDGEYIHYECLEQYFADFRVRE